MDKNANVVELHKKGYELHVHTWENDGDNWQVHIVHCETEKLVKDLVEFCKLFWSKNNSNDGIGNIYDTCYYDYEEGVVGSVLVDFMKKHKNLAKNNAVTPVDGTFTEYYEEPDIDSMSDKDLYKIAAGIASLLGLMGSSEYYTRVFSRMIIYYYDSPVFVNVVTSDFIEGK